MGKVHVTIDGIQVYVPDTYTVLEAAKEINIHIPTLCFLKDVSEIGCCRMCLVEVKGTRALQAACGYPVRDGMLKLKMPPYSAALFATYADEFFPVVASVEPAEREEEEN